jgi:hypothetical protein
MAIDHKQLRRLYESAEKSNETGRFFADIREGLASGQLKPNDFSIRKLWEQFVPDGRELLEEYCNPEHPSEVSLSRLMESDAVKASNFVNITGQIVYTEVLNQYTLAANVFSPMIPVIQTPFNGEKIAGIGGLGDNAQEVAEGAEYPSFGVNEDWIDTPEVRKRGFRVEVTKEALFFDRTGQLITQCGDLGTYMGINREKRAIDCIIDENTTAHRYNRKGRGAVATYGDNSGNHDWDNLQASNALQDWTDIDLAQQLLNSILDPNTGEPIALSMTSRMLIVTDSLAMTARYIMNATETERVVPGYQTSGNVVHTRAGNPVAGMATVASSVQLAARMATDSSWFLGDPSKAFRCMQNFPLTVVQAPANSELEFSRDIVMQYKASEKNSYTTYDPRYMVKCTA